MPYYRCAACGLTSYSAAAYSTTLACATCSAPLNGAAKIEMRPGGGQQVTCDLVPRPQAAGEARRAVLPLALPELTRENLAVIVTELVTNAVCHARLGAHDTIRVEVTSGPEVAHVAVRDPGRGFEAPPPASDGLLVNGGRGLLIVDALSESWGVKRDDGGCTVWSDVAIAPIATAMPATNGHAPGPRALRLVGARPPGPRDG